MRCPKCGNEHTRVIDSRMQDTNAGNAALATIVSRRLNVAEIPSR